MKDSGNITRQQQRQTLRRLSKLMRITPAQMKVGRGASKRAGVTQIDGHDTAHFEIDGWAYIPDVERLDDRRTICHLFRHRDGRVVSCDFTGRAYMDRHDARRWFRLGMPPRPRETGKASSAWTGETLGIAARGGEEP